MYVHRRRMYVYTLFRANGLHLMVHLSKHQLHAVDML